MPKQAKKLTRAEKIKLNKGGKPPLTKYSRKKIAKLKTRKGEKE